MRPHGRRWPATLSPELDAACAGRHAADPADLRHAPAGRVVPFDMTPLAISASLIRDLVRTATAPAICCPNRFSTILPRTISTAERPAPATQDEWTPHPRKIVVAAPKTSRHATSKSSTPRHTRSSTASSSPAPSRPPDPRARAERPGQGQRSRRRDHRHRRPGDRRVGAGRPRNIVVHVMQPAVRAHYKLEELWNTPPSSRRNAA